MISSILAQVQVSMNLVSAKRMPADDYKTWSPLIVRSKNGRKVPHPVVPKNYQVMSAENLHRAMLELVPVEMRGTVLVPGKREKQQPRQEMSKEGEIQGLVVEVGSVMFAIEKTYLLPLLNPQTRSSSHLINEGVATGRYLLQGSTQADKYDLGELS